MYRLLVFFISLGVVLMADIDHQADYMMNAELESIKNKYHIVDENPEPPIEEVAKVEPKVVPKVALKVDINKSVPVKVKSDPKDMSDAERLKQLREELEIPELTGRAKEIDRLRRDLKIDYEVPKRESFLDKKLNSVKEALHMDGDVEGEYSFSNTIKDLKKTLHLEGDATWGLPGFSLPNFFGTEKKKKKQGFFSKLNFLGDMQMPGIPGMSGKSDGMSGLSSFASMPGISSIPGMNMLSDVKGTGTKIYKGMKYSGQSAEMMSGMMYNSSKMYNTMFGMFDDSPFNMFGEEEEETSIFNLFEGGNAIMNMFGN